MEKNINKYLKEIKLSGGFIHMKTNEDSCQYKPIKMNRNDLITLEKVYEENCAIMASFVEI